MYIIVMNSADNPNGYMGAICVMDGNPWYVTGLAGPTIFPTEKGASFIIKKLSKAYSDCTFEIMPIELYLSIVDPLWPDKCEWLKPMIEKYGNKEPE